MNKHSEWQPFEHEKLMQLRKEHKDWSYQELADKLTELYGTLFTFNAVRNRIRRNKHEIRELPDYKTTTEICADGTHKSDKLLRMSANQSKDVNYLLEAHGFDTDAWELVTAKNNIWNVYSKLDKVQTLYSSKVTVRPKKETFTQADVKNVVLDLMKNYKSPTYKPSRYSKNGKLLELNISDLHLNKLGYIDGEYDSSQAEEAFFHIINDVLTRTELYIFEKILFIWSHDFFNIDNLTKTTTAGTPQDVDKRYSDMFKQGKRILIQAVDLLRQFAPVETVQVGANHDNLTSYTMSEVLDAWFRNDDNVTIDNNPAQRKYRRFGKCLIGFSHGDKEKKRLGKAMPVEARKDWGETLFAEIHAAHLHSEQAVTEENGVIVRYLSSPSGTDKWHYESAYVGAIRKAQSFIWDKELGLTDILHTTIV